MSTQILQNRFSFIGPKDLNYLASSLSLKRNVIPETRRAH
jgi:hypothetical protein